MLIGKLASREVGLPDLDRLARHFLTHAALVAMFGEPGTNVTHDVAQDAVA